MRILLVPSPEVKDGRLRKYVPYGLLTLQAVAKEFTTSVHIFQWPESSQIPIAHTAADLSDVLFKNVDFAQYDVVGFSAVSSSIAYIVNMSDYVRRKMPGLPIIYGGPYVTKLAQQIMAAFQVVDAIFVGESEKSFADFLARCDAGRIDFLGIPGVLARGEDGGIGNIVTDLDSLPFLAATSDFSNWFRWRSPETEKHAPIPLEATRGCPLQCSFCSTRQVWGPKVRRKSPRRLVREMAELSIACGGSTFFNLIGDNIGAPRNDFLRFCGEFALLNPGFSWGGSLKVDRFDQGDFARMWAAGMRAMFVGLESGNQQTLDRVRKKTNIAKEIDNVRAAVDVGFRVTVSFIIGFPWERRSDIDETYRLHCDLIQYGVDRSQINVLMPIPGTDIVADGNVLFEPQWLRLTGDGVATFHEIASAAKTYPELFSHFGRYETDHVDWKALLSIRDAAELYFGLNRRRVQRDWNVF